MIERRSRTTEAAVALFVVSVAGYLIVRWLSYPTMIDLAVYRVEGQAIRDGVNLYGNLATPNGLRATYPPFAALLFVPFTYLPWLLVQTLSVIANIALLVLVCHLSMRLAGAPAEHRVAGTLALAAVGLWAEPVFTTLRYGQINLALLALVLWDFQRPPSARTRGIGVGLAVAIKITPAVFVVYLLLTRRLRMALIAGVTFVVAVAVSALAGPSQTWRFWTSLIWDSSRVGRTENAANQSITGMTARFLHTRDLPAGWPVLMIAVLVIGVVWSAHVYRRAGDAWGIPVCAVVGMLAAPIAWTHHWVWCIPIAALLWVQARRWLPLVVVFWTFAVWAVPHVAPAELHFAVWQSLLSLWYVLFGLAFLVLAGSSVPRARDPAGTPVAGSNNSSRR